MPIRRPVPRSPRKNPISMPRGLRLPPRPPMRTSPFLPPRDPRGGVRPGPSPEMVGEDFVLPELPEYQPQLPPMRPDRSAPQRPAWEPGGVEGAAPQFAMSQDIMDLLMEMLMRRSAPGGRAA